MKKILSIFLLFIPLVFLHSDDLEFTWQLPVKINDSRFEVYNNLGIPQEIISYDSLLVKFLSVGLKEEDVTIQKNKTIEHFNDQGLAVIFIDDVVSSITLQQLGSKNYSEFSGKIVNDLLLTDSRQVIFEKLGLPTSMTTDPLPKRNSDEPVAFASHSHYKWSTAEYDIEIDVTNERMKLSDILILNKDEISVMRLYSIEPGLVVKQ